MKYKLLLALKYILGFITYILFMIILIAFKESIGLDKFQREENMLGMVLLEVICMVFLFCFLVLHVKLSDIKRAKKEEKKRKKANKKIAE